MQTTSQLLLWVMGRIKRLQRGYAVSYCKKVKYSTALACTDGSVPISYTLFIKQPAQPTKHQKQSRTVCESRAFSLPHTVSLSNKLKNLCQRRIVGFQILHCSFEARLDSLAIMFLRSLSVIEPCGKFLVSFDNNQYKTFHQDHICKCFYMEISQSDL